MRKHLPALLEALPAAARGDPQRQPEHKAVLEGEREIVLTPRTRCRMRLDRGRRWRLRPASFFQTNTEIAEALYAQARDWVAGTDVAGLGPLLRRRRLRAAPRRSRPRRDRRRGVRRRDRPPRSTAAERDRRPFRGRRRDVVRPAQPGAPDLVVVNPPRRGIGPDLAGWLESSGVEHVVYSSCNAESLARDLAADAVAAGGRGAGARHVPAHHSLRGDRAALPLRISRDGPGGPKAGRRSSSNPSLWASSMNVVMRSPASGSWSTREPATSRATRTQRGSSMHEVGTVIRILSVCESAVADRPPHVGALRPPNSMLKACLPR